MTFLPQAFKRPRLLIGVEGDGFLWHMVRIMVGTLAEVGLGRFVPDDIPGMLAAYDWFVSTRNGALPLRVQSKSVALFSRVVQTSVPVAS